MPATSTTETYRRVTERIVQALERGDARAWVKPWSARTGRPRSISSGKAYQGINSLVLGFAAIDKGYATPYWATYRQYAEIGAHVRKGEKGTPVLFYKELQVADRDNPEETARIPLARIFTVFSAAQVDNLPERYQAKPADERVIAGPQQVLDAYLDNGGPSLRHVPGDKARYFPAADTIELPERGQFSSPEAYYSVAFHEAGHSSGAAHRLDREGIAQFDHHGSDRYAREELVAQLTSAMLCAETGIGSDELQQNDVAYLASWARTIKAEPKILVQAASQAGKATDHVLEPSLELQKSAELVAEAEQIEAA